MTFLFQLPNVRTTWNPTKILLWSLNGFCDRTLELFGLEKPFKTIKPKLWPTSNQTHSLFSCLSFLGSKIPSPEIILNKTQLTKFRIIFISSSFSLGKKKKNPEGGQTSLGIWPWTRWSQGHKYLNWGVWTWCHSIIVRCLNPSPCL